MPPKAGIQSPGSGCGLARKPLSFHALAAFWTTAFARVTAERRRHLPSLFLAISKACDDFPIPPLARPSNLTVGQTAWFLKNRNNSSRPVLCQAEKHYHKSVQTARDCSVLRNHIYDDDIATEAEYRQKRTPPLSVVHARIEFGGSNLIVRGFTPGGEDGQAISVMPLPAQLPAGRVFGNQVIAAAHRAHGMSLTNRGVCVAVTIGNPVFRERRPGERAKAQNGREAYNGWPERHWSSPYAPRRTMAGPVKTGRESH
jgi:hypothetical protein